MIVNDVRKVLYIKVCMIISCDDVLLTFLFLIVDLITIQSKQSYWRTIEKKIARMVCARNKLWFYQWTWFYM